MKKNGFLRRNFHSTSTEDGVMALGGGVTAQESDSRGRNSGYMVWHARKLIVSKKSREQILKTVVLNIFYSV